ncbi:helix-turn-helix transcriptional regulator [Lelliottia wanjuensis]|uniref:helix-turn-helix transcriptional regulator n=1 Tax=Lelliottia wanjuensis TaxID=3050585 RepID=UPI003306E5C2
MSNLKVIRKNRGFTQMELASELKISQSAVCHYESGTRKPDISTCHRIVKILSSRGDSLSFEDVFPCA